MRATGGGAHGNLGRGPAAARKLKKGHGAAGMPRSDGARALHTMQMGCMWRCSGGGGRARMHTCA